MYIELSTEQGADMLMKVNALGNEDGCYNACYTLMEYLEQFEQDMEQGLELDPVAVRCDWDYATLEEIRDYYYDKDIDDEETLARLEEDTTCIHVQEDRYIYIQF